MVPHAESMQRHLETLRGLRGDSRDRPRRLDEVKHWQAQRLAATYADLATEPRYRAATEFFLEDLYGPKDFSGRDQAMLRILPVMTRALPDSAVETAALAIELEALSEDLDQRLAGALGPGALDPELYARAYRESSTPQERHRQIDLIESVGRRLDALVRKPFVHGTLKLMRRPAKMAGLEDLQDFLERGFQAFVEMRGAEVFLETVRDREEEILRSLFSGKTVAF
jgi:hypothetical protein